MVQGHCAERQFNPLLLRLLNISFVFTAEHYNVACSSNSYSFEIDGLLAGGRRQHTGLQACHFSALEVRRARRKQLCTTTRLLLPQKQSSRCNRRVRPWEWSKHWKTFRHGTGVQSCLETCLQKWRASMVEYFRKRHQQRKEDNRKRSFPPLGYGKECFQQAPLVVMREGTLSTCGEVLHARF